MSIKKPTCSFQAFSQQPDTICFVSGLNTKGWNWVRPQQNCVFSAGTEFGNMLGLSKAKLRIVWLVRNHQSSKSIDDVRKMLAKIS